MKGVTLFFSILIVAGSVYAAKPPSGGTCVDVPISWEFMGDGSGFEAIVSDGLGAYREGVDGITSSVVHSVGSCVGSNQTTKDATLAFSSRSRRKLSIKLGSAIDGSIIDGGEVPFANGNAFLTTGPMNIRNVIGYPVVTKGLAATYFTKASGRFLAPNSKDIYQWGSIPDDFTCPSGATCVPDYHVVLLPTNFNQPEQTAWVKVTYMPRNLTQPWSLANTDKWLVEAEFTSESDEQVQRVTFHFNNVHRGQYSFPFRILITALAEMP